MEGLNSGAVSAPFSAALDAQTIWVTGANPSVNNTVARTFINNVDISSVGPNFLIGGDTNIYGAYEGAYIRLVESQLNNNGRGKDEFVMNGNWHQNSGQALHDSQCPCLTPTTQANPDCQPNFSGGGMDDRFDLWLSSYSLQDGQGLDYLPTQFLTTDGGSYPWQYGNDGQHFNLAINGGVFNNAVGLTFANALHDASDHLPVVIVLQVPAKVSTLASLNFGTAILGGSPTQNLTVSNVATAPADGLSYTLAAPAGFSAPGGAFEAAAGASANNHAIGMNTASIGAKNGTLTVNSDDVDVPTANVSLSGTVLDHAAASLDSSVVTTSRPTWRPL
jgi:hypothetical protein